MQIDGEHPHRLRPVHMADDSVLSRQRTQFRDRIEVSTPRHVTEGQDARGRGQRLLDQADHMFLALEGAGNEDRVHLHPISLRAKLPGSPPGGMLLTRHQDFVTRPQAHTYSPHVQRLGCISRERDLVRIRTQQRREPRNHAAGNSGAQVVLPPQWFA